MRSLFRTFSLGLICSLLIGSSNAAVNIYGHRVGRSIATAQSVIAVNPSANQTPDSIEPGDLAVTSPSNTGHGTTTASAFNLGPATQAKSCRWFAFQPPSGQITKITLKVDWSISGYVNTSAPDFIDSASAAAVFHIMYSINNGISFNGMTRGAASSVFFGAEYKPISDSGSFSVDLPANTPINQIIVSDRLYTETSASGAGSAWAEMTATTSNVRLEVETVVGANCIAQVPENRWKGEYYSNTNLAGSPAMVRNDGTNGLNFNFGNGGPGGTCGLGVDNFSVRWTRVANFAASTYRFSVTGDDGVRLYVDGHLKIDKWFSQVATTYTADVTFSSAGPHQIKLEYFESGGPGVALLSWADATGVNCLPNEPLPLISSATQTAGKVNIASTAPSQAPKRCGQKNSD
jgi:PA14 domain